jgi:S1-C subfamily serine protease
MFDLMVELSNGMAQAAAKAAAWTVMVEARKRLPSTGIAFSPNLVLTASHAVQRDENITIAGEDGVQVSARSAGRDPGSDLAVLHIDGALPALPEKSGEARVGQLVLALGRPTAGGIEASLGVISAAGGPVRTPRGSLESYLRTDAVPLPGFSGGPLVDAAGRLVGVNTSGFGTGSFLSIPAGVAWKIAAQLAEHGSFRRGYLGIRSQRVVIPAAAREALQRDQSYGLLVVSVEAGSPAEQGELMVGDILVGLEGAELSDHDDLVVRLAGEAAGKTLSVEVVRGGAVQVFPVQVGVRAG